MALAEGSDAECAVRAHLLAFSALWRLGRHGEARAAAPVALARARAAGLSRNEAVILNEMGNYATYEGDFGAAINHLEQALALHRRDGNRLNEGGTLANLAFAAMRLGDYATAQRQFMQALALSAAIGQRRDEGIIRINLGLVLLNLEQAEAAQGHARQALALVRAAGDRWGEAAALRVAGQAALVLGDAHAAADLLSASREQFDALEMPHLAIEAMAVLAAAALARGDRVSALASVEAILGRQAAGAALEGTDEPLRIRLTCWQVLDAVADARAADLLATAWRELSSQAERIGDPQRRQAFMEAVPFHRQIVAAWRGRYGTLLGTF
jgi:tetratricopeptide (TPR) repeat protein